MSIASELIKARRRANPAMRRQERQRRAAAIRARLREMLGGCCVLCGSTDDLHFDHINPSTKSFSVSARVRDTSIERLIAEVKCQLLCSSCHREKTRSEYRLTRSGERRLLLEAAERRHARRHGRREASA